MKNSVIREELSGNNLAIADIVYHKKYGLLSYQPMSVKEYSLDGRIRMSTKAGMVIWISEDERLLASTIKERNDFWKT